MTMKLLKPFGANTPVDDDDVRKMKHALNRRGYYMPDPKTGMTEVTDKAVFEGLKKFQQDHSLKPTGIANPVMKQKQHSTQH